MSGVGFRVDAGGDFAFDFVGVAEFEGAEGHVDGVAGHVAEGAGAEVVPAAPFEAMIDVLFEGPLHGGSEPEVPVEVFRDGVGASGAFEALGPDGAVGPDVEFEGVAEDAGLDDLDGAAEAFASAALVAHLGGKLVLPGEVAHGARLPDGLSEWLLAEDVLFGLHGHDACHAVDVVGGGNGDAVDLVVHLLEHDAEVLVVLRLGMALFDFVDVVGVDVAEGHEVAAAFGDFPDVGCALSAHSNSGDAGAFVKVLSADDGGEPEDGAGAEAGGAEEFTTRERAHIY